MSNGIVNENVQQTRARWDLIEDRKAQRKSPGGGRGEPQPGVIRVDNYTVQTGGRLTPRQLRRFNHKYNRTLRSSVSTLDGGL